MKSFTTLSMIVLTVALGFAVLMPATAQGGLVSYWPFTTDASDVVGPNDGTLMGSASVSGGELVLPGATTDYVDCGADASLNLGSTVGNDWTVVAKLNTLSDARQFLLYKTTGHPYIQWGIQIQPSTQLYGRMYDGSVGIELKDETEPADGVYHHYAMTVKDLGQPGGQAKLYFDGELKATEDISGMGALDTAGSPFFIGNQTPADLRYPARGTMDDVALWNEVIPDSWIEDLADGTHTPLTVPEPASAVLLLLGLPFVMWRKRR